MAARCNVRVCSALLEPQLITSARAEDIVPGWSPSQVEAIVREALGGERGSQAQFHKFLDATLTRPVRWICKYLGISSRLDGGTMGNPYMVDPIAVYLCQLFQVLTRNFISGRLYFKAPLNSHECKVLCYLDWVWNRAVQKPIYRYLQHGDATPEEDI